VPAKPAPATMTSAEKLVVVLIFDFQPDHKIGCQLEGKLLLPVEEIA
jgi:hypothetical protein